MVDNQKKIRLGNAVYVIIAVFLSVLAIQLVRVCLVKFEGEMPAFQLESPISSVGLSYLLKGSVSDQKSGLRKVWIALLQEGKEKVVLDKEFPAKGFLGGGLVREHSFAPRIDVDELDLTEGEALLRAVVQDYSWRGWWSGNRTYKEYRIRIDIRPPIIDVLTNAHNLNQGGSGLVIYRVSEPDTVSGVQVDDSFFSGYKGFFTDPGCYIAFFAIPHDKGPESELHIRATDPAGNTGKAGFFYHINKRSFKQDEITISDAFLRLKMPEFDHTLSMEEKRASLIDKFVTINRSLRLASNTTLHEVSKKSTTKQLWKGSFLRLPRSARSAGFAEHRKYRYKDKDVDEQTHLGIDLASTSRSPVPAANNARVAFADYLGIYGKTVVLDHGFGLISMYGHLSEIVVEQGDTVARGDIVGLTGTTGLAGGDHLHYAMMVGNVFVNPIEWWDSSWIEHNVASKLRVVKEMLSERGRG